MRDIVAIEIITHKYTLHNPLSTHKHSTRGYPTFFLEMRSVDESSGTGPEQCEDQPGHNPDGGEDHSHTVHH